MRAGVQARAGGTARRKFLRRRIVHRQRRSLAALVVGGAAAEARRCHVRVALEHGGEQLREVRRYAVGALEPVRVGRDKPRVVARRVDGVNRGVVVAVESAVAVGGGVLVVERSRYLLRRQQERFLRGRVRKHVARAARGNRRDRRFELGPRVVLAGLFVEGRVEEGGVGLVAVALRDARDELREAADDRVGAGEVSLRVGHAARVIAAEGRLRLRAGGSDDKEERKGDDACQAEFHNASCVVRFGACVPERGEPGTPPHPSAANAV